jgi:hypothetical protein
VRIKITRKELSFLISRRRGDKVTVDQVRFNEKRWGLKPSRGKDLNQRVIRYDAKKAVKALKLAGVIT